jgi:hypothetical protein
MEMEREIQEWIIWDRILIICGSISPNNPKMAGLGTTSTIPLEINY